MYTLDQEVAVKVEKSHFRLVRQLRLYIVYVVQFPKQKSVHQLCLVLIKYNRALVIVCAANYTSFLVIPLLVSSSTTFIVNSFCSSQHVSMAT